MSSPYGSVSDRRTIPVLYGDETRVSAAGADDGVHIGFPPYGPRGRFAFERSGMQMLVLNFADLPSLPPFGSEYVFAVRKATTSTCSALL